MRLIKARDPRPKGWQAFVDISEQPKLLEEDGRPNEITIYEPIGIDLFEGGMTAKRFRGILRQIKARDVTVKINSPGGDVFEAVAIYNEMLSADKTFNIEITGLAASAASLLAMAGDSIRIGRNAFVMIHNAWALAMGDRPVMQQMADTLAQIDAAIAETYAERAGGDPADWLGAMEKETWYRGSAAVEAGLADSVMERESDPVAARYLTAFARVPEDIPTTQGGELDAVAKALGDLTTTLSTLEGA